MISLWFCSALDSGTLTENGIVDGTEVRLVPAIESGVTVSLCYNTGIFKGGGIGIL